LFDDVALFYLCPGSQKAGIFLIVVSTVNRKFRPNLKSPDLRLIRRKKNPERPGRPGQSAPGVRVEAGNRTPMLILVYMMPVFCLVAHIANLIVGCDGAQMRRMGSASLSCHPKPTDQPKEN
jgi:hypothetical protein